jgi:predicted RNA-binding protein YlxR (DUF448 family)
MAHPDELVRITKQADGSLAVGRLLPGRGAWLCAATAVACLDLAVRRRAWRRALRADVDPRALVSLRAHLEDRARMEG